MKHKQKSAITAPVQKNHGKNAVRLILRAIVVISVLLLLLYFISLLSGFQPFFSTTADSKALVELEDDCHSVDLLMKEHFDTLADIAQQLSFATSKEQVDSIMISHIGSQEFGDLRYFCQGVEYSTAGLMIREDLNSVIGQLSQSNQTGISKVYFNSLGGVDCMALYMPVKGSTFVDGIVSVMPARDIIDLTNVRDGNVAVMALVTPDGKVLCHNLETDFPAAMENNFLDFMRTLTQNKEVCNEILQNISKNETISTQITGNGVAYTVASGPLKSTGSGVRLVNLSRSSDLTLSEMKYIRQIIVVSVIAIFALLISLFFAFLFHSQATRKLVKASQTAPELGCANALQFRRRTGEILSASNSVNWYVLCVEVRQFAYLTNTFGYDATLQQLKYIAKMLVTICQGREFFSYCEDGVFQILLHCKDQATLHNRIQQMIDLIEKSTFLKQHGVVNGVYVGVYGVGSHRDLPIGEILEYASSARNMAKSDVQKLYILYTDEIRDELMRNNQIEAQMEDALANGEFKLFLQPKYDVRRDCVCNAEALVRWFDPRRNDYIFPVEFIPLFEANGFVTKLDHFMYLEVCKYFQNAAAHGDKVIPIAVNVSRVTAMRPDFLEFYIGNKKRYGVADGFLTVEMTESFAMQNYEAIQTLVEELHKNGIRCSIDDFGSGYSSFEILKKIPMDELKMDRVFIADGIEDERDKLFVKTIIELSKALGMQVVQEGVETKEVFDEICAMGCDMIQGFYYARAIPLEEYRIFINSNTSIRYKAQVK